MLRIRFVLLALSLTSCYDSFDSSSGSERPSPPPNADIADLHACYYGETVTIGEPIVIRGRVTSDDTAGNFYRTLLIQDRTAGVEIMAGLSDLHTSYPPGYAVTVIARGLAIGERYGVLRLGLPPLAGDLLPDYIGAPVLLDRHLIRGDGPQPVEPLVLALADLTQSRCGLLVEIRGLTFQPDPEADGAPQSWNGYRLFTDEEGNEIRTYTSDYARHAREAVPTGRIALRGILQYGPAESSGSCFQIKMRDADDCLPD